MPGRTNSFAAASPSLLARNWKQHSTCLYWPKQPPTRLSQSALSRLHRPANCSLVLTPTITYFGNTTLAKIGQTEIDAAAQAIYPGRSAATINRQLYSPISAVLRRSGIAIVLKRPKGAYDVKATGWLWPEEASRLFTEAEALDVEFGILCILMCHTGLRLGEALGLATEMLRMDEAFAYVRTTKNGLPRPVFLPATVLAALARHPRGIGRPHERLFKFHKGGHLYILLRTAAAKANVTLPERQALHLFRHTYGTWMRRYGGLDTRGLVDTGTWKNRKSAERYEHVVVSEEAQRAEKLPGANRKIQEGPIVEKALKAK